MRQEAIFGPFFGMVLLTFSVWVCLYYRRIKFLRNNHIDLSSIDTPDKATAVIPTAVALSAHNLRNLFELPVEFYVLCLFWYVSASVDLAYVSAAWIFVGLRVLHSLIHCTYNKVIHRFAAYFVAALVLWSLVFRTIWQLLATN